jgi:hypothetical protein
MKTKILFTSLAYMLLCSLIFVACCKKTCTDASNPECENYDKCLGKVPNAEFKMRQAVWDDVTNDYNHPNELLILHSDTLKNAILDFESDFDSIPGTVYAWKIQGMSKIIYRRHLRGINFNEDTKLKENHAILNQFCKPLKIDLTVSVPKTECTGDDTIKTFTRYLTLSWITLREGFFKGTFSTNPDKEVTI